MNQRISSKLSNQLLPSLLDRVTDLDPRKKNEIKSNHFFSLEQYKKAVLRDILFLLNTTCWESNKIEDILPDNVRNSTVNYGIPAFSGNNFADIEWQNVENVILTALLNFEPRLEPTTLVVNVIIDKETEILNNHLIIEIKGDLKLNPYPQEFILRTTMDIETGMFNLVDSKTHE